MKTLIKLFALLIAITHNSYSATSSRCIHGEDWTPLCEQEEYSKTRCDNAELYRMFCNSETAGCPAAGCFGDTPPGSWYPLIVDGKAYRCRCGCFGEDTTFGPIDARALIKLKDDKTDAESELLSSDDLDFSHLSSRPINGIMYANDTEAGITLTTATGKTISLSNAHPVVVAAADGKFRLMKQASLVQLGELLISDQGRAEAVVKIDVAATKDRKMNFNVKSTNPAHHIVSANGLMMGDLGYQTKLHSIESRMMLRSELSQ